MGKKHKQRVSALIRTAGDDQEQAEEGSSSNQEDSQTHLLAKIWRRLYECKPQSPYA